MFRLAKITIVPLVCLIGACSNTGTNYTPVVDGAVGPNYANDLAACQSLARQQGTVDGSTLGAAATGAALAGGTQALINNKGNKARDAAAVGALVGVTGSAIQNTQTQEVIIRNCMRGRGYNVVG